MTRAVVRQGGWLRDDKWPGTRRRVGRVAGERREPTGRESSAVEHGPDAVRDAHAVGARAQPRVRSASCAAPGVDGRAAVRRGQANSGRPDDGHHDERCPGRGRHPVAVEVRPGGAPGAAGRRRPWSVHHAAGDAADHDDAVRRCGFDVFPRQQVGGSKLFTRHRSRTVSLARKTVAISGVHLLRLFWFPFFRSYHRNPTGRTRWKVKSKTRFRATDQEVGGVVGLFGRIDNCNRSRNDVPKRGKI